MEAAAEEAANGRLALTEQNNFKLIRFMQHLLQTLPNLNQIALPASESTAATNLVQVQMPMPLELRPESQPANLIAPCLQCSNHNELSQGLQSMQGAIVSELMHLQRAVDIANEMKRMDSRTDGDSAIMYVSKLSLKDITLADIEKILQDDYVKAALNQIHLWNLKRLSLSGQLQNTVQKRQISSNNQMNEDYKVMSSERNIREAMRYLPTRPFYFQGLLQGHNVNYLQGHDRNTFEQMRLRNGDTLGPNQLPTTTQKLDSKPVIVEQSKDKPKEWPLASLTTNVSPSMNAEILNAKVNPGLQQSPVIPLLLSPYGAKVIGNSEQVAPIKMEMSMGKVPMMPNKGNVRAPMIAEQKTGDKVETVKATPQVANEDGKARHRGNLFGVFRAPDPRYPELWPHQYFAPELSNSLRYVSEMGNPTPQVGDLPPTKPIYTNLLELPLDPRKIYHNGYMVLKPNGEAFNTIVTNSVVQNSNSNLGSPHSTATYQFSGAPGQKAVNSHRYPISNPNFSTTTPAPYQPAIGDNEILKMLHHHRTLHFPVS